MISHENIDEAVAENGQASTWDGLSEIPKMPNNAESQESSDNKNERLMKRARLYRKFGKVACALAQMEEAKTSVDSPERLDSSEGMEADALIAQVEAALESVDKSLENQLDYSIVNHKQINTRDALEHELESGTGIPELDIRFDKDGKPWISHSPRAGTRFFFSKPIHMLSSEEVAKYGQRLSLEDGLDIIRQYHEDNPHHKLVLEIKELGPTKESALRFMEGIKAMLEGSGLTDSTIFATLSPSILRTVHDVFPKNSKILNGGIAPIISYDIAEKTLNAPEASKEFAFKLPNLELFFSNSTEITERQDGYGKQTGYLWARLPKETVKTLSKLNQDGQVGAASLAVVNMFANVLEKLSPKAAQAVRKRYAQQLEKMGLTPQIRVSKKDSAENLMKVNAAVGRDTVAYADTSPGDWAEALPKKE